MLVYCGNCLSGKLCLHQRIHTTAEINAHKNVLGTLRGHHRLPGRRHVLEWRTWRSDRLVFMSRQPWLGFPWKNARETECVMEGKAKLPPLHTTWSPDWSPGSNSKQTCKNVFTALYGQRCQMMAFQQPKILTSYKYRVLADLPAVKHNTRVGLVSSELLSKKNHI